MAQQKTSEAEHYSARINPKSSENERLALEIIHDLEKRFSFKEIAVDAIIRAKGHDPAKLEPGGITLAAMEGLFANFAQIIISQIKQGGIDLANEDSEPSSDGNVSPFAQNIAKSYVSRRKSQGDE